MPVMGLSLGFGRGSQVASGGGAVNALSVEAYSTSCRANHKPVGFDSLDIVGSHYCTEQTGSWHTIWPIRKVGGTYRHCAAMVQN